MTKLGQRQTENLKRAIEAVESVLGPGSVGEVGFFTHIDAEGCYDPESGQLWLNRAALLTVEIAVEGLIQGICERESGCPPVTEGYESYMRRLLARTILELHREREARKSGMAEV